MTEISSENIKKLREQTGAGMMDCKKALVENKGDYENAVDWLRKKGLAAAAKKSSRVAAEGVVAVAKGENSAAIIELNSETDFVARNDKFQTLARNVAEIALKNGGDFEKIKTAKYDGAKNVLEAITENIAAIGENMNLRRTAGLTVSKGVVASYIHSAIAPNLGKIGIIVALESAGAKDKLEALGKQLAMHIAASKPDAVTAAEIDPKNLEREKEIFRTQAKASGKPDNIIDKMIEGRVRKYYEEVVLLEQVFVMDGKTKVSEVVENAAKEIGSPVKVTSFVRFTLGEGIEKQQTDFAEEVKAAAGVK